MAMTIATVLAAIAVAVTGSTAPKKPNMIFLLTDDQDTRLGSTIAMPKTLSYIRDQGANVSNFFIHTPICCPSRTTLLSGRYVHNNRCGSSQDPGCMRMNTSAITNPAWWGNTVTKRLHDAGYTTGMFGKVLNIMSSYGCQAPYQKLPEGVDRLMIMCTVNYYNSVWADFATDTSLSNQSVYKLPDYTTSVVGNESLTWIKSILSKGPDHPPFFAYLGPHAPHLPSTPAPWYADHPIGKTPVPKDVYYNYSGVGKHSFGTLPSLAEQEPIINSADEENIALEHGNRLKTLLSVDDIVSALYEYLTEANEWDNTYFFTCSDHGYSLGQFRIDSHKTQVWDHNTRVPVFIKGPGIKPGTVFPPITSMVDLAPTILELAAGGNNPSAIPDGMDGYSFAPLLTGAGTRQWKTAALVEYQSIRPHVTIGSTEYISAYGYHMDGLGKAQTHAHDGPNNTFAAIRVINHTAIPPVDLLYAEFFDVDNPSSYEFGSSYVNYRELYDVTNDYYMLNNVYNEATAEQKQQLGQWIQALVHCKGTDCRELLH